MCMNNVDSVGRLSDDHNLRALRSRSRGSWLGCKIGQSWAIRVTAVRVVTDVFKAVINLRELVKSTFEDADIKTYLMHDTSARIANIGDQLPFPWTISQRSNQSTAAVSICPSKVLGGRSNYSTVPSNARSEPNQDYFLNYRTCFQLV